MAFFLSLFCNNLWSQQKPLPWGLAKKEYKLDESKRGKVPLGGDKFRIVQLNNQFTLRDKELEFLDKAGKPGKSIELREAPFAPSFLGAKETENESNLRMHYIWIDAENMTRSQKISAIHPDYRNDGGIINNLTATITEISIIVDGEYENDLSGCFIIKYKIQNYVKGRLHNINTRLVFLDEIGNPIDIIDNVPFAVSTVVVSDDRNYICYKYEDFINTKNDESISPIGLRLYDRERKKYLVDRMFPNDTGFYPYNPVKIESKIVFTSNGECLGKKGYTVVFVFNPGQNIIFRKDEKIHYTPEGYGYGGEISEIKNDIIYFEKIPNGKAAIYNLNKDFQKMTFEEFNQVHFISKPQ